MSRVQFWLVSLLAAVVLLLAAINVVMGSLNRGLQLEIGQRQQFVQQSVQLEGLYREIIRALAELGARHNDEAVRSLLAQHGITYTVNPPAAPAPKK